MSAAHRRRRGFVEHTIEGLYQVIERTLEAEDSVRRGGVLQSLDPRVKVAGLFALILVSVLATRLSVIAAILALAVLLAALSLIPIRLLAARVWIAALFFTGAVALPALFLTPGPPLYRIPALGWAVTAPGATTAAFLVLRAETAATLALLLVLTTPWMHVLKALRIFRVPVVFVVVLGMTSRYILLLVETAHEMFESRQSRTVGQLTSGDRRRMAVASAGVLLGRTLQLGGDVYLAMQARGFRGEVYLLDDFRMTAADWLALAAFAGLAAAAVWAGR
ncbi:MAG: cobalt ECF transporter T component CbiQ [Bryobacteraceae bacterium]|jgi:cobalt ECF transporter T component CbiQ